MTFNEALVQPDEYQLYQASKYAGTKHPESVDWSSAGGPETNLGKRAKKKKKEKYPATFKLNPRGFEEVYSLKGR